MVGHVGWLGFILFLRSKWGVKECTMILLFHVRFHSKCEQVSEPPGKCGGLQDFVHFGTCCVYSFAFGSWLCFQSYFCCLLHMIELQSHVSSKFRWDSTRGVVGARKWFAFPFVVKHGMLLLRYCRLQCDFICWIPALVVPRKVPIHW